jgi:hypothetical protein
MLGASSAPDATMPKVANCAMYWVSLIVYNSPFESADASRRQACVPFILDREGRFYARHFRFCSSIDFNWQL